MKNKSIILGLVSAVFTCNLIFTSCSEPKEVEKITFLEKRVYTAEDSTIDLYYRMKGEAHGGEYFSRTDSANQYGIGATYSINDTTLNKDLRVKVSFWAKSNVASPNCVYAIALHDGDKIVSWNQVKMDKYLAQTNKWTNVNDSVTIPGSLINKTGLTIRFFTYNLDKNTVFDGDDLEATFFNVRKELVD